MLSRFPRHTHALVAEDRQRTWPCSFIRLEPSTIQPLYWGRHYWWGRRFNAFRQHGWIPNHPFHAPHRLLDDPEVVPGYQRPHYLIAVVNGIEILVYAELLVAHAELPHVGEAYCLCFVLSLPSRLPTLDFSSLQVLVLRVVIRARRQHRRRRQRSRSWRVALHNVHHFLGKATKAVHEAAADWPDNQHIDQHERLPEGVEADGPIFIIILLASSSVLELIAKLCCQDGMLLPLMLHVDLELLCC
mmetsp:Transcript_26009/g.55024  ORF Transcript_26009/g.55024 Transcript_26009/m.55024 type:complete len:245 (-) Transcript_26009:2283-3017(-)